MKAKYLIMRDGIDFFSFSDWSEEFPEAELFNSAKEAEMIAKELRKKEVGELTVIKDYGLSTQKIKVIK